MRRIICAMVVSMLAVLNVPRGAAQINKGGYLRHPYAKNVCDEYRPPEAHNNTVKRLEVISTGDLRALFYCDLQEMGGKIKDYEYKRRMQTSPISLDWSRYNAEKTVTVRTQFWDVRWAYGFNSHKLYRDLEARFGENAGALFSPSGLESLVFIKKEFPGQASKVLRGWTSFPYNQDSANINPTANFIYEVKFSRKGIDYSSLLMKYSEHPWYLEFSGTGFADYFRFLTKDIIIAKGVYGFYNPMDSNLPRLAGSPDAQQFWMERISEERTINLLRENKYFSTPILKWIWDHSMPGTLSGKDLAGSWAGDLVMNITTIRSHANLAIDGSKKGELKVQAGNPDERSDNEETYNISSVAGIDDEKSVKIDFARSEMPLVLRRVGEGVEALVGKRCLKIKNQNEIKSLDDKYHYFLPGITKNLFLSQFLEKTGDENQFCHYYLFRKIEAAGY